MNVTDILEKNYERNLCWIDAADSKVGIILAINTAMLGILAALISQEVVWARITVCLVAVSMVMLLTSIVLLAVVVFPRICCPNQSLIYFGGVTAHEFGSYKERILELDSDSKSYIDDLIHQCYRTARIAKTKFCYLRLCLALLLFVACPLWLLSIYVLY